MKVTLAYPHLDADGVEHEPDTTIDVDDEVGANLIHSGRARPAEITKRRPAGLTQEG